MLLDSQIVPESAARPRSFVGLMALYESNFLRLIRLIPQFEHIDGCFQSRVAGDCDLHVEILERSPYTLTLSLTYHLPADAGTIIDPDMIVRAYLDGQQAEVLEIGAIGGRPSGTALEAIIRKHGGELDRRWRLNIILNKWLDYLYEQGHLVLDR